jgi:hypothetical protein
MMKVFGALLIAIGILGGLVLAAWLGGYLMLYKGIVGAITAGQAAAWAAMAGSIIKAVLFEWGICAGVLLGAGLVSLGALCIDSDW